MEQDSLREVDLTRLEQGYQSQWELMGDLFAWLDLHLYYYYREHRWLGPASDLKNMLGLVVSREEFEHNLARAAQTGLRTGLPAGDRLRLDQAQEAIGLRTRRTDAPLPLLRLFARCGLDQFQQSCVILAYAVLLDRKYEKLFAYLQDDMTGRAPRTDLAVQLFLPEGESMEDYVSRFSRKNSFTRLFRPEQLAEGAMVLRETAVEFLSTGTVADRPGRTLFDGGVRRPDGPLAVQMETARRLDRVFAGPEERCICLSGPDGGGKRFQVEHLMGRSRDRCVFADLEGENWRELAEEAALAANLTGACLCLYHLERRDEAGNVTAPEQRLVETLAGLELVRSKRFLLSRLPLRARLSTLVVELELPPVTEGERLALFRTFLKGETLGEDVTAEELAAKFRFSPRQIRLACRQAGGLVRLSGEQVISGPLIHQCCYREVVHKLGALASPVPAAYTWDDVVMPQAQKELMRRACGHIKYQHQVYCLWGFEKKISYGRGLSILFAGAPGTGKTMCAQVMAKQLNMEMYKVNISQIVSKYIGETEKNLQAVFAEARHSNCILFFDECDALFGKRSEVKDSHDRNANVEVAYLLQQIEEYDGVCVLATNLIGNIDEAFMRRITYVIRFPFPDPAMRAEIYRRTIPADAPLSEDIDWDFLARKFELSGGHIKNIVLAGAFMAAGEGEPISMRHLLQAAVSEMKKNEIVVVREELREYADLLESF